MDSSVTFSFSTKRRGGSKKRVVEIPMKDVERTRIKGDSSNSNTPPSDSWAWRKYGQKPIKGSPYPRGYYRCSSSKNCPARKQVERSRVDPTMLLITYSSDHNHALPQMRNHRKSKIDPKTKKEFDFDSEPEPEERSTDLGDESLSATTDVLGGWLGDMEIVSPMVLEIPIFSKLEASMLGEEEESLFADLGELPECSAVFRQSVLLEREDEEATEQCECRITS